ncbi:helicase SNF [Paenibacillus sp. J31TS4]|uniref:DEAD/DEAH box helicase n=1 Tax=Paenibacillus sp. J31TS4 TaxID=2807195 RepID=UPI001B215DC7|nr:DEAD/DEAH box helicase [Paenibacillus sp. J31TS4]GIP37639.1 helicase SNF [Paenibacillus sp. J31TS4]
MGMRWNERIAMQLCGRDAYEQGKAMVGAGEVEVLAWNDETGRGEARVGGAGGWRVVVTWDGEAAEAICPCSGETISSSRCAHAAAALLAAGRGEGGEPVRGVSYAHLLDPQEMEGEWREDVRPIGTSGRRARKETLPDEQLFDGMLELFRERPRRASGARPLFDTRDRLEVQFLLRPVPAGGGRSLLGIELKLGPKRLYVVPRIRDFLDRVDRGEGCSFTRQFVYDPDLHCFPPEADTVIRQLIWIARSDELLRDLPAAAASGKGKTERVLPLPPDAWDELLPLLQQVPSVQVEHGSVTAMGIVLTEDPLPVRFRFERVKEDVRLVVQGLDDVVVLAPYGLALADGRLTRVKTEPLRRLAELKKLLPVGDEAAVPIPGGRMERFLEQALPGLRQLGTVEMTREVSDKLVQHPLKAKLFLDRVRDRLLAALEFHYGDLVINPLEEAGEAPDSRVVLLRDGERERRILELMEQGAFAHTDSGFFLEGEEAEYEFLYHIVPRLQRLVTVYATTAVKERLVTGTAAPKLEIERGERTDWLAFRFELDGIRDSEIREVLRSLEEKRRYHRLSDGSLQPLEGEAFQQILRYMNETGVRASDVYGAEAQVPLIRGLSLAADPDPGGAVRLGKSLRRLLDDLRDPERLAFPVPAGIEAVLRDYQKEGYQWMKTLAHYGFGGILADEMGLGKTVQAIAFLQSVLPDIRRTGEPALIVCPSSLLYNWRNELRRFAPEIRTVIADGDRPDRHRLLAAGSGADVVITSYPLLRMDEELYAAQPFHTLLLDEAQAFKNRTTQTARAVMRLAARHRFALTGTPIENSLEELRTLFDAVFPGLLPDRLTFREMTRESVAGKVKPFLLRRLKADVLKELPGKIESEQASELFPEQKTLYAAYLAHFKEETFKHLSEKGFEKSKIRILAGLTRLRQLCCHPALFVDGYAGSSAKLEQLLELVDDCRASGRRILVFSQFTSMLGIISRELAARGIPFFYLDGSTPAAERVNLCSRFNEGEKDLFLLSLKAGGTGLNLTGADTVILYDLWWNPAVEQQAQDRAHRLGQKKVVQVVRLVAQGTVEEKMVELQRHKQTLFEEVVQADGEGAGITEADIRQLLAD